MLQKPGRSQEDFNDEVQSHIRLEADRLVEEGLDREAAMAAARRSFGNVTHCRERFYETGRWLAWDRIGKGLGRASRRLRNSPGTSAIIILSIALGVGSTTAIFSLAYPAIWRTLLVVAPEALVQLRWDGKFIGGGIGWGDLLPYAFHRELRDEGEDVFEGLFARAVPSDVFLTFEGESEPVTVEVVTGSYFSTRRSKAFSRPGLERRRRPRAKWSSGCSARL